MRTAVIEVVMSTATKQLAENMSDPTLEEPQCWRSLRADPGGVGGPGRPAAGPLCDAPMIFSRATEGHANLTGLIANKCPPGEMNEDCTGLVDGKNVCGS